jgi:hypothetical protein
LSQVVIVAVLNSCAGVPPTREYGGYPYDYYCPVSDVTLAANELEMRFFGHAYVRFPQSIPETGEATIGWYRASLTDCSTPEFACVQVEAANTARSFYLFVPRRLEAKREYTLHGARAVTTFATAPHISAIQVTLWQPPGKEMQPMKLTIERSRGVVYWSGMGFWDDARTDSGETCILQSPTGLFNQVELQLPSTREVVPD